MRLPEFRFTAYSGTGLENFKRLAFVSEGRVFYKKDQRFPSPEVYYTTTKTEAIYYARSSTFNPLIMCARLPICRWPNPIFRTLLIFPVDHVLIPDRDLPPEEFPLFHKGSYADNSKYFRPADIHQILGI